MEEEPGFKISVVGAFAHPCPHCLLCFLSEHTKEYNPQLSCSCAGSWDRRPNSGPWILSRNGTPLSKEAGACTQPSGSSCRACKPNAEKQRSTVKTAESLSHRAAHRRLCGNQNKTLGWAKLLFWQQSVSIARLWVLIQHQPLRRNVDK